MNRNSHWSRHTRHLHFIPSHLDAACQRSVATRHLCVDLGNGAILSEVPHLLVHVVGASAAVIAEPDTKVFDVCRPLLLNLSNLQNFAVGLFDLSQLAQQIPETGGGQHLVGGKQPHAKYRWVGLGLSRDEATHHLVLPDLERKKQKAPHFVFTYVIRVRTRKPTVPHRTKKPSKLGATNRGTCAA